MPATGGRQSHEGHVESQSLHQGPLR